MKLFMRQMMWKILSQPIIRAIGWTSEERDAFDAFCRSSCGTKFLEYLRQVVAHTTFNAVYRESVSANAYARGQQDVLVTLHRLRVFPALQEESSFADLSDSELPEPASSGARRKADDWRFLGGRGAIG
jgi:hypothetical protein